MTNIQYVPGAIDAGGCVSNGWELIKRNYWMYFGITSLVAVVSLVLSCIPFVPILFQVFVMPPITVGIFLVLFKEMRGEPVEFGMFFKGFDKFVPALVIGVINSIPSIIFLILNFAYSGEFLLKFFRGLPESAVDQVFSSPKILSSRMMRLH